VDHKVGQFFFLKGVKNLKKYFSSAKYSHNLKIKKNIYISDQLYGPPYIYNNKKNDRLQCASSVGAGAPPSKQNNAKIMSKLYLLEFVSQMSIHALQAFDPPMWLISTSVSITAGNPKISRNWGGKKLHAKQT
jgi:hypothetical protein